MSSLGPDLPAPGTPQATLMEATRLDIDAEKASPRRRRLGEVLIDEQLITQAQLDHALQAQASADGPRRRLGQVVADLGYATEREVASLRIALREVATRDFVRSELRTLLDELEQRDRVPEPDENELDAAPPASA